MADGHQHCLLDLFLYFCSRRGAAGLIAKPGSKSTMEHLGKCLTVDAPDLADISPMVSVVIPTYNYAHFLIETLESALSQTYSNFELIVVDDGSTDETRTRLEPYRNQIRYIYQENQGLSAARNTGIRAAQGELIALLDSDDLWHPRKLEIQVRYLIEHPNIGLLASDDIARIYSNTPAADLQEEAPKQWPTINDLSTLWACPLAIEDVVVRPRFGSCGVLIRKECFHHAGYFDTSLRSCEDRDMWIRIARLYPVAVLELPLWWYRQHANSMSTDPSLMEATNIRVLRKSFENIDLLRRRRFLRQKAWSRALYSSALTYMASGMHVTALTRIARSLLMWPLPYRREEVKTRLARLRCLIVIVMRALRLRQARFQ
jgi:glycosyltransferase involved in cell wall biosynthesis